MNLYFILHFHKHTKFATMVLMPTCIPRCLQLPSLFGSQDISKYQIRCQLVKGIIFQGYRISLFVLILHGTAKTSSQSWYSFFVNRL